MRIGALQKAAAQAIVNIFETGSIRGDYGDVTLLPGDTGQLTYGRSQTTLASGNLYLLIKDYCARSDASLGPAMKPYLDRLAARDSALNHDMTFRGLLKDAGDDPVMQEVQDLFFDRVYWEPAMRSAEALGVGTALGAAVVYDSTVHGSWARMRERTRKEHGELKDIGEEVWIARYVEVRRHWLATHSNTLLHKTVYRMDCFRALIGTGNWDLALPFAVRGHAVTADALQMPLPVKVSADVIPPRLLLLRSPAMSGPDVVWLQERLSLAGISIEAGGIFNEATDAAVRAFQAANDLTVDGIVGPATRTALEDIPLTKPESRESEAMEPMPAVPGEAISGETVPAPVETPDRPAAPPVDTAPESVPGKIGKAGKAISQITDRAKFWKAVWDYLVTHHPALAGFVSVVMLALSDLRDFLAWAQSGPLGQVLHWPENLPKPPRSLDDAARFFTDLYAYFQGFAASLPAEWVYRIRVAALVLFAYALYRLMRRSGEVKRLRKQLAEAQALVAKAREGMPKAE